MFGPPGVMARAASGEYGDGVYEGYGLFPHNQIVAIASESACGDPDAVVAEETWRPTGPLSWSVWVPPPPDPTYYLSTYYYSGLFGEESPVEESSAPAADADEKE